MTKSQFDLLDLMGKLNHHRSNQLITSTELQRLIKSHGGVQFQMHVYHFNELLKLLHLTVKNQSHSSSRAEQAVLNLAAKTADPAEFVALQQQFQTTSNSLLYDQRTDRPLTVEQLFKRLDDLSRQWILALLH